MRVDHLGIATDRAEELASVYENLLGGSIVHRESGDINFVFVEVNGNYFEFLEPADMDSDIGRHVREHGTGFHHVGIEVEDLPAALEYAREMGVELIDEEPRSGAWGHDIAFLDPDSTGGMRIELFEE